MADGKTYGLSTESFDSKAESSFWNTVLNFKQMQERIDNLSKNNVATQNASALKGNEQNGK